jgi:hypothetical protein
MRPRANPRAVLISLMFMTISAEVSLPQKPPASSSRLGNLRIEISKVDQTVMVGDSFSGLSSYRMLGKIYLKIRNDGDFPACVAIVPTVEEYKGSELQHTQSLRTALAYNPKIQNLPPGAETSGYYEFNPSPQIRNYALVLQERNETQPCEKLSGVTGNTNIAKRTLRLALPPTKER